MGSNPAQGLTYKIVNYKVPNGELTNGIRYINKESLFRVINPSASVNKGITEPISLTQGRCKNPWSLVYAGLPKDD